MANKLGVNLMVWSGQLGQAELARLPEIKAMGYVGVELPIFDADALNVDAVRRGLVDAELSCTVSTALPIGMTMVDEARSAAGIAYLNSIVDAAAAIGSSIVCGPLALPVGELRGRGYTQSEWDCCVRSLRTASDHAAEQGVTLAFEPLNRFETYFLNTVADGIRLAEAIDSPAFGLLIDTFHANIEEKSTADAIRQAAHVLKHFHTSENDRGIVGSGQVPWPAIFDALRDVDYSGWIVVESFNAVIAELAGATCVWRPLAKSPENLAGESASFLQEGLA